MKISNFPFGDAYSIRRPVLIQFIDHWINRISKPTAAYDFILGDFASKQNSYAIYPIICKQYVSVSQISGKSEDKSKYTDHGWKKYLRKS